MSEDEYDNIPDDFAETLVDVDWSQVPGLAEPPQEEDEVADALKYEPHSDGRTLSSQSSDAAGREEAEETEAGPSAWPTAWGGTKDDVSGNPFPLLNRIQAADWCKEI